MGNVVGTRRLPTTLWKQLERHAERQELLHSLGAVGAVLGQLLLFAEGQAMPIAIPCLGCGGKFRTPDEAAGKRVKCPKCSAMKPKR